MKKLAYILPSLLLPLLLTPLFSHADLTTNLVAYWKMDEDTGTTASDATGNGHTGTLTGSGTTWGTGIINYATVFGGTSGNFVSVPASAALEFTGDFTINVWIYPTGYPSGLLTRVFDDQNGGSPGYDLAIGNDTPFAYERFTANGVNIQKAGIIVLNQWQMLTAVVTSGGGVTLYYDGTSETTGSTGSLSAASVTIAIGNRADGARQYIGRIDEVGAWSRALSSTEVSQLYNSGVGLQYPFTVAAPTPARHMRLFEGYKIKLVSGKLKINQQ